MKRGRPAEGPELVEKLDGSDEGKRKLRAVLESVVGEKPVEEICAVLGIGKTAFYELRERVLRSALAESEPKAAGRPRRVESVEDEEVARLKKEVEDLRMKLEVAYVREEIMLGMPQVFEPLKKKLRRPQDKQAIIDRDDAPVPGGEDAGGAAPRGPGGDRGGGMGQS